MMQMTHAEYGPASYDSARRRSVYVELRDGVRRALDYYLPARAGRAVDDPLPVVYQSQRYVRAWAMPNGTVDTPAGEVDADGNVSLTAIPPAEQYLSWFLLHGYALVIADMRGAGASFGAEVEQMGYEACLDEYDVIEWIAAQPWCNGKIAMSGISYGGESQIMAAFTSPPHLRAIAPSAPEIDRFHGEAFMMGGIYRHGWQGAWDEGTRERNDAIDPALERTICPVEGDSDRRLLHAAVAERSAPDSVARQLQARAEWEQGVAGQRFWDRIPYSREFQKTGINHMMTLVDGVNRSGIPTLLTTGWLDSYTAGNTRFYNRLTVPKKLIIGPWAHGPGGTDDGPEGARGQAYVAALQVESIRWFDHWLKGADNGVTSEGPITYALTESTEAWEWLETDVWPPHGTRSTQVFLGPHVADSVASVNDGTLSFDRDALEAGDGFDSYRVSYEASTGRDNRWFSAGTAGRTFYSDLRARIDIHGLTFTTTALDADLCIVGHPIVQIFATADCEDLDFITFLEVVHERGESQYLTEGMLRASHRVLGVPPYPYAGLPFPDSSSRVVASTPPLSAGIAELAFELYPIAARLRAGKRLRLSLVHIDGGNTATPVIDPAPRATLFRDSRHPSHVVLPLRS